MGNQEVKQDKDQTIKQDAGKLNWAVFPLKEAEEVVKVFEYGAKKYSYPFTYRKGIELDRLFASMMRHIEDIQTEGYYSLDNESQCLQIAHVAAVALMMISQHIQQKTKQPQ